MMRSPGVTVYLPLTLLALQGSVLGATNPGLYICYGTGSICGAYLEFENACAPQRSSTNFDPWYRCLCTTGYVAVEAA